MILNPIVVGKSGGGLHYTKVKSVKGYRAVYPNFVYRTEKYGPTIEVSGATELPETPCSDGSVWITGVHNAGTPAEGYPSVDVEIEGDTIILRGVTIIK